MRRRDVLVLVFLGWVFWPVAGLAAGIADVARALRLPDLLAVMREEGIRYGRELEAELFPGAGGGRWESLVAAIHETGRMQRIVEGRLEAELGAEPDATEAILTFFAADPGARIVALELAGREALLDDSVRDAAELAWQDMQAQGDPRLALIGRLVEANDLLEQNVAGALNGNMAFYRGMIDGGAMAATMPEAELMADLWSQEPQIRAETEAWLMPYMVLAYRPLSDADLEAYVTFSRSVAGQVLNRALFAAFEQLFGMVSRDLGVAAAQMVTGEDI